MRYLLLLAAAVMHYSTAFAQSFSVDSLSANDICGNSNFLVFFTDQQSREDSYTAEISIVNFPDFPMTPVVLGTGTGSPLKVSLPKLIAGGAYQLRLRVNGQYSDTVAFTVCNLAGKKTVDAYAASDLTIWRNQLAWAGQPSHKDSMALANDYEVYYYDGNETYQVTKNRVHDVLPTLENGVMSWVRNFSTSNTEIYYYRDNVEKRVTQTPGFEFHPKISDGVIVWGSSGKNYDVFSFDGNETTQITNDAADDAGPEICQGRVLWQKLVGADYEIFLYEEGSTTQLTDNAYDDGGGRISDELIAWVGYDGHDNEIFVYKDGEVKQITNNDVNDYDIRLSGSNLTWQSFTSGGSTGQVYYYTFGGEPENISAYTAYNSGNARISGNIVVFDAYANDTYNREVYLFNGTSTIQLSMDEGDDMLPVIHDGYIAWTRDMHSYITVFQVDTPCENLSDVVGEIQVSHDTENNARVTTLSIDEQFGASQYVWKVEPMRAGVVTAGGSNNASLMWDDDFTGDAIISVRSINRCDISDLKSITIAAPTITNIEEDNQFQLYPIPSNGTVYLKTSGLLHGSSYEVLTIEGKPVMRKVITNAESSFTLNPGVYVLRLLRANSTSVYKLIVY
ncbi:T9SS type A sorting domain-containing protein [Pseudochryseolinea flava]|uniref:Secretion system C-terminal sorting domain-containing protein n=1 Tax=Pseudochryseolinea flava TaxID=2059302 RepID=A0A364XXM7_9BACT|nr:T9SS type A sorting domain-containing protein [Pseudochryseolinea flava]RAV98166.1 hypothetical protein DQQ10_25200 [Pseudochryseolinea flava]